MSKVNNLASIIGPTAVGKSEISLYVAQGLDAEILSCDSMQVYKGMDIGTAKVSPQKQMEVKHHLIDIVNPDQEYTVVDYQTDAQKLIKQLNKNNTIPILVGGTGLYYQAVVDDYTFYPMETRNEIREKWEQVISEKGLEYAYEYLKKIDNDYAKIISNNDQRRIIRAIEVYEITGKPFSTMQNLNPDKYNLSSVGLYLERQELYAKINNRVLDMLDNGLIEEVIILRKNGYNQDLKSMQSLGYKQICYYLDGFLTKEQMISEIQRDTRRFAKRQFTWFNKDKRITWFDVGKHTNKEKLVEKILKHMEGQLYKV